MLALLGAERPDQLVGRSPLEFFHPDSHALIRERIAALLAGGTVPVARERVLRLDGTTREVESTGAPFRDEHGVAIQVVLHDVTESLALQAKMALSSRLEAMGTLVAGVAHEVNNPLAAALADQGLALELAREARERFQAGQPLDPAGEIRSVEDAIEALEEAQEAGLRIARIVKSLATFGRPDPRRERIRLADVVTRAMRWAPPSVAKIAVLRVEDGGAPDVLASEGQLEQVVVNLVTNAARAMPEGKRGLIVVRTSPGSPGMARLDVTDDGAGIEPAMLERIFEPFFTTRPAGPGRGSGLGLAICHTIVTAHGGTLSATSTPGAGSTFRVELPAAPPVPGGG
jgi:PAS domain S-box-containing protein